MKLSKAIEILTTIKDEDDYNWYPEYKAAMELTIEATKRLEATRLNFSIMRWQALPGETEEDEVKT